MSSPRRALTLLEVLVALAVLILILATAFPARRSSLAAVSAARELGAAKDQLVALRSYASDNRDRIIPSAPHWVWTHQPLNRYSLFPPNPWNPSQRLGGNETRLWPMHLIGRGYLQPHAIVLDRTTRAVFESRSHLSYPAAIGLFTFESTSRGGAYVMHPSLGMNAVYVGGGYCFGAFRGQGPSITSPPDLYSGYGNPTPAPNPRVSGGQFYVQSFAAIKRPSQLIIYASARGGDVLHGGAYWGYGQTLPNWGTIRPGYFAVLPPTVSPYGRGGYSLHYTLANAWNPSNTFNPAALPGTWGMMDMRHENRAVTVTADGHAELQTLEQLRDMRKWANMANRADWAFPTNVSQISW